MIGEKVSSCKKHFAHPGRYDAGMQRSDAQTALAKNLTRLIADEGFPSMRAFAPRTGVTDRTLGNIINQTASPSLETVEKLAAYFRVPAFILLIPGITVEDIRSGRLARLVAEFAELPEPSRAAVSRVAEMEARYSLLANLPDNMPDPDAAPVRPATKAK